jgi:hypothetical protein
VTVTSDLSPFRLWGSIKVDEAGLAVIITWRSKVFASAADNHLLEAQLVLPRDPSCIQLGARLGMDPIEVAEDDQRQGGAVPSE